MFLSMHVDSEDIFCELILSCHPEAQDIKLLSSGICGKSFNLLNYLSVRILSLNILSENIFKFST